jgi:response regulator RpfG family c-di-GMP phosphodiesterase
LVRLREVVGRGIQQVVPLLVRLIDLMVPGAAERGTRAAALAAAVAERFGVPERLMPDQDLAARLHEVGRVAARESSAGREHCDDPRHYVVFSRALLAQVDALQGAAELVAAMHESWDGSGFPGHLQSGQIPLRSRILRVVVDFLRGVEEAGEAAADEVLAGLREHSGTLYDPVVLVHLGAVLDQADAGNDAESRTVLPVSALRAGMVLAEDLSTDGGLKLLARDTLLTPPLLEMIQRRHQLEPIVQGAAVRRA